MNERNNAVSCTIMSLQILKIPSTTISDDYLVRYNSKTKRMQWWTILVPPNRYYLNKQQTATTIKYDKHADRIYVRFRIINKEKLVCDSNHRKFDTTDKHEIHINPTKAVSVVIFRRSTPIKVPAVLSMEFGSQFDGSQWLSAVKSLEKSNWWISQKSQKKLYLIHIHSAQSWDR